MLPIETKNIRIPLKIGEEASVGSYSSSLINGEEQILVTRNGKVFLTNGAGGYFDFRFNSIYTQEEIDNKFTAFTTTYDNKIKVLSDAIVDLGNDLSNYVLKTDYDTFKLNTTNSISTLDGAILDLIDDLADTTTLATHTNRDVLDRFSVDVDGKPLFDGVKLASSIETTVAEMDTSMNLIWGDTI